MSCPFVLDIETRQQKRRETRNKNAEFDMYTISKMPERDAAPWEGALRAREKGAHLLPHYTDEGVLVVVRQKIISTLLCPSCHTLVSQCVCMSRPFCEKDKVKAVKAVKGYPVYDRQVDPCPPGKLSIGTTMPCAERGSAENGYANVRPNSWSRLEASSYNLRSRDYNDNSRKFSSHFSLYDVFAVDIIKGDQKIPKIVDHAFAPKGICKGNRYFNVPGLLLINFMFPEYSPNALSSLLSGKVTDGKGQSLVFYCALSRKSRSMLAAAGRYDRRRRQRQLRVQEKCGIGGQRDMNKVGLNLSKYHDNGNDDENKDNSGKNANNVNDDNDDDDIGDDSDNADSDTSFVSDAFDNDDDESEDEGEGQSFGNEGRENSDIGGEKSSSRSTSASAKRPCRKMCRAMRLLLDVLDADEGSSLRRRLKCIPRILNLDDCDFGVFATPLVKRYNGTPFMIRDTSTYYRSDQSFSIDIDVHNFSTPALMALDGCKAIMQEIIFDCGLCFQGENENELGEQILCCLTLNKWDKRRAATLPSLVQKDGKR